MHLIINFWLSEQGNGIIEGTNISEGRGTTRPFEIIGGKFIDSYKLVDYLSKLHI